MILNECMHVRGTILILLGALSSTSANWLRLHTMKGSLMNSIRHEADPFRVPTIQCKSVQKVSNVPLG